MLIEHHTLLNRCVNLFADREGIHGERFRERVANMGFEEVVISLRSP
ncbi:MAG: hypothetical protein HY287_13115 [Planctomycetes bacterium]|nr:hypothetical protein [Planctomycetota bacterium]